MATTTYTAAPTSTRGDLFYAWAHPIAAFMVTAGWLQQADTGQVVWPATIVNITAVAFSTPTTTYTYTVVQGSANSIHPQASINIKNCTSAGNNGTFLINTLGSGTFSVTNASGVAEAESATTAYGSVDIQVSINNAVGNGATNTYTYQDEDGILLAGQSIVIKNCTTSGFNGTFTIASIAPGTLSPLSNGTFTTVAGGISHASEAENAGGIVSCYPAVTGVQTTTTLPSSTSNQIYEIWKMGDGNGLNIFLKIGYCGNTNAVTDAALHFTLCNSTDGAGNATGGSTGQVVAFRENTTSASVFNCYLAGSTNRLHIAMFANCTTGSIAPCLVNIERSHAADGSDTTAYATMTVFGSGNSGVLAINQTTITATANTVAETRTPTVTKTGTLTGSFGSSTILSPVFPIAGAVGNPLIGLLVGKVADWTDATQFSFTLYNTSRNYIVLQTTGGQWVAAGAIVYDSSATCCPIMRYE